MIWAHLSLRKVQTTKCKSHELLAAVLVLRVTTHRKRLLLVRVVQALCCVQIVHEALDYA